MCIREKTDGNLFHAPSNVVVRTFEEMEKVHTHILWDKHTPYALIEIYAICCDDG